MAELARARRVERAWQIDRRARHRFMARGDQAFLPMQALDLPRAEAGQEREAEDREQRWPDERLARHGGEGFRPEHIRPA